MSAMDAAKNKNILLSFGRWTIDKLDHLLQESSAIKDTGERIEFISRRFLGVGYKESTLIGDINTPEVFVVNLEGIDCMTFVEYVEAMRLSASFPEFVENLKKIRYKQGKVAFKNRNHFFTDWINTGDRFQICPHIEDVTERIGGSNTKKAKKRLNLKKSGGLILHGIPSKEREIKYIPVDEIDNAVLDKLKTGDYAGIYSQDDGLDVSHVGIIIKGTVPVSLRHASSQAGKVVDEDFKKYIAEKQGTVVLRPCRQ
jgi:hypothetical protein